MKETKKRKLKILKKLVIIISIVAVLICMWYLIYKRVTYLGGLYLDLKIIYVLISMALLIGVGIYSLLTLVIVLPVQRKLEEK